MFHVEHPFGVALLMAVVGDVTANRGYINDSRLCVEKT